MMGWRQLFGLSLMATLVHSFASTDSPQDTDPPQSGYLPNHNINPSSVASSFTVAWKNTYNNLEVFYAKPLVYTPSGAPNEYVITVSNQNIVRVTDGLTGALIKSRTLDPPFASSDTNCGDIPNTVGITGTPIIDTATDIMYFFSKGYKNAQAGPQGTIYGQYKFYAVQLPGLTDISGFPVSLEGHNANNDPTRYFVGGTVLNRPGLAMFGNTIVGGFGGHCDNFNYTGMLVSVSKTPGVGVTNIQAMEASPGAPSPQTLDITQQGGGKAGIWQSGMGLAADTSANRVFFVTGNARGAGQNGGASGKAASGKVYLSTLEQAACNFAVNPSNGLLTQQDYFEPYGYDSNNGGDIDFGSSGIALLDPGTFYGTGVSRIGVAGGKDGLVYILNADNLGGFAGGNAGSDHVIQTITDNYALLGGAASYPLEGGYLYLSPATDSLYAYKFQRDGSGNPSFVLAGKSAITFAGKSAPVVTSMNGQAGTGIVWIADTNRGLTAFNAVPVNGVLTQIVLPTKAATGGLTKYQRAVFGNGRAYACTSNTLQALSGGGQTQSAPLTCTPNPAAFGSVMVLGTSQLSISCTANTAVSITSCTTGNPTFQCGSSSLPSTVASGQSFTFPVTFNLTDAALLQYENQTGGPLLPGAATASLNLYTTASASNYLPDTVIPLTGTVVANGGYLTSNLITVSFGGVPVGTKSSAMNVVLSNKGSSALTFTGFAWQDYYANGMPYNNVTVQATSTVGNGYTASNFPAVGSTLAAGASLTIPLTFSPSQTGIAATYLTLWSDGGYTDILMKGIASAVTSTSSTSSSTTSSTTSKTTTTSSTTSLSTSSSVPSSISSVKSSSSSSSLGSSTTSTVASVTTTSITPSGTLNPLEPKTIGTFNYIGCYQDLVNNVRSLTASTYTNATMTLEMCAQNCANYDYFGVEFHTECYCGYTLNSTLRATETDCSDACGGNSAEICGQRDRLSVYQNTVYKAPPAPPAHVPTASGFVWQGCYTEGTVSRALTGPSFSSTTMTVEACIASCVGYSYAGVEYAQQCYCGNAIQAGSVLTSTSTCSMPCLGSGSEYCGGSSVLDMYFYNPAAASSLTSSLSSTQSKSTSTSSTSISVSPTVSSTSTSSPTVSSTSTLSPTVSSSSSMTTKSSSPSTFSTSTTSTTSSSSSTVSLSACPAKTAPAGNLKTFNWNVGWVNAAPDGFTRPFIGINGQWPCPPLSVNIGDKVKINVVNGLVNETTAIHFHGIFQKNTTYADGPAMVTQCPIQPGATFVYEFTIDQPGTYWYHAHVGGQYIDGLRGPLIVNDAAAPYQCHVNQEIVMTVSDLYHEQAPNLISYYQSPTNANNNNGAEPVPDSALINEQQNVKFPIVAGQSYLFRIINMGAFAPQYVQFDQHTMTVVEVDGVYTQPYTVNQLFIAAAQRYSVIIQAKTTSSQNFAIVSSMSTNMFNPSVTPADLNTDVTAWLVYNSAATLPAPFTITPQPFDESQFLPWDQQAEFGPVTLPISLTVDFGANDQNQIRGMMNGVTYIPQKVPTLYTVLSAPANEVNNAAIYGANSNSFVLPYGAVVEVSLANHDSNGHPFHLHGHNFQVVDASSVGTIFPRKPPSSTVFMRRDTVMLQANGYVVLRFIADNPGVSLFHCHIEWHVESGLTATFIEAPTQLQAMKPYIPVSHRDVCSAQGISMKGNAAGNTADYTNLNGSITEPSPNPWGALVVPGPQPT